MKTVSHSTVELLDNMGTDLVEIFHALFTYSNGELIRKVSRGNRLAGALVNTQTTKGYLRVLVAGKRYTVHQVVWAMHHWKLATQIDHINGNKKDNRIENLREVNTKQNCANQWGARVNNKLNVQGVHMLPSGNYRSSISLDGVKYNLGVFSTKEEAHNAYIIKKQEYFA